METYDWMLAFQKQCMRGSRKYCHWGSNSDVFGFLVDEGGRIKLTLKAFHHRPASETPLKWRFAGEPMVAQH